MKRQISLIALSVSLLVCQILPGVVWAQDCSQLQYDYKGGRERDVPVLKLVRAQGLKVLWWNIGQGNYGRSNKNQKKLRPESLDHNLSCLALDGRVDVFVLGEFTQGAIHESVRDAWTQADYVYQFEVPYNEWNQRISLKIVSRRPLEQTELATLTYGNGSESESEPNFQKDRQENLRPYVTFRIQLFDGRYVYVAPIHLLNPWPDLKRDLENEGRWFAKERVGYEIFFGLENPLIQQVRSLLGLLNKSFGHRYENLNRDALLVIGDFNFPSKYFGIRSQGIFEMTRELRDVFRTSHEPTFPADAAKHYLNYPKMKIDHAFTNRVARIERATTMGLAGSDHYPIGVALE